MKPTNNILVSFAVLMAMLTTSCAPTTQTETPTKTHEAVPASPQWVVTIFLPDIAAVSELNTDSWLNLADLPTSNRPEDSYRGFRLPNINAVYTWDKSVIESLTSKCSTIIIDYKNATAADLSALPIESIVAIGICGPQVRVVTTSALTAGVNPALISTDLLEFVAMAKAAGYDKQ